MLNVFDCKVTRTQSWTIRLIAESAEDAAADAKAAFSDGEPPDAEGPLVATVVQVKDAEAG